MGLALSKFNSKHHERRQVLRAKIQVLEEEIEEMRRAREQEVQAFYHYVTLFACKEEAWMQEWQKDKEEIARLRLVRWKEEKEDKLAAGTPEELRSNFLVERMKAEQARREAAVEKWKQLYLAIKAELDDLIQRIHQGERLCWGVEQGVLVEGLEKKLKAKEDSMESLRQQIEAMEKEGIRRDREIDILRQSHRILSNTRRNQSKICLPRRLMSWKKN
ncbi:uncharacterized protein [Typha latifolia]|uniref:uncharacterized protein n=1 Tax=Typha latifolia TaxID=4733 RepID=UPI003C2EB22A